MPMYHDGNRRLQDQFGSTRLADRLVERLWRDRFNDEDKAFIESVGFFFLATADRDGHPDCSFKGGPPGFVKVHAPDLLIFPTTMAMACSRASATSSSIHRSACCS